MNRSRRSLKLAGLSIAMICCLASFGPIPKGADEPPKEPASYVRPIKLDETTRQILQTAGTYSVGFEYQIPADRKAVFILVARDEKQIIKSLTKIITIAPHDESKPHRNSMRLTLIDPAMFTEGYKGKIRWVFEFPLHTQSAWEPSLFSFADHGYPWTDGKTVNDPETEKDYLLWELKVYQPGLHMIMNDSPTIFDYQILFRVEPFKQGDNHGAIGTGEYEDYVRVMKERKKRQGKK